MAFERRDRVGVRVEHVGDVRVRPGQHDVEQLGTLRMDAEVEDGAFEQPAVRNNASVLLPELRAPFRLTPDVLEAPPRQVADVLRPSRPA